MNATTLSRTFLSIALMLILAASLSLAQVPKTISYQGVLTDASGTVVPDGNYNLTFKLYDVATGGTALWAEGQLVAVSKGIFNVILGSVAPLNLPFNKPYYLGVTVGAGAELSPRMPLTSSGYSFRAANTDSINGITAGGDLTGTYPNPSIANNAVTTSKIADGSVTKAKLSASGGNNGDVLKISGGNLAWGPDQTGGLTLPYSGSASAVAPAFQVTNSNSGGAGVQGTNSSSGNYGYLGGASDGIYGKNTNGNEGALGGPNNGVYGLNNNGNYGYLGGSGYGAYGYHNSTGNYGYLGSSDYGVYGKHNNSGNYGYLGSSSYGVVGYSSAANGGGVLGDAENGSNARGVSGSSSDGIGVHGYSISGTGLYGYSSTGTAVYGSKAGGGNYAGYFSGNVNVTGTLSKGGGSFKIDHPLDPANKYLYHSFVESPDMMNIYNGNVTLDANGEAWVELPAYFEALNKDFRYQLTAIGAPGPNLYIAQEISGNRFKIAGGSPGMKVSWQVTGVRHDPFAEAHRIQVEVEKTGNERGKYIHPKEYGVSETLGIDYEEHQKMEAEQERMKAEQERMQKEVKK